MAGLAPLRPDWEITAAVASQISDGAGALLIASEAALSRHGLTPLARVHTLTVVGSDPVLMLTGPIEATRKALARAGMKVGDIDVFEVNEAFAPVLLAWSEDTGASLDRTNPNGGAIALGHPLGATGAILMTKLVHELERTGGRFGLQTMCEGGGQANATIVERVSARKYRAAGIRDIEPRPDPARAVRCARVIASGLAAERVADAAAGVDERRPEPVELASQVADVGLHHLRLAGVAAAPHALQEFGPAQHAALMAQQAGEQPEFGRGQVYRRSRPVHRPPGLVEHEVAAAQHARLAAASCSVRVRVMTMASAGSWGCLRVHYGV